MHSKKMLGKVLYHIIVCGIGLSAGLDGLQFVQADINHFSNRRFSYTRAIYA